LDEPLTHLDKENINNQLQTIKKIQKHYAPSILIISHHFIEEMKEQLQKVNELFF
jgi:DNA repair exonuclease SbcCD ATPase subunit